MQSHIAHEALTTELKLARHPGAHQVEVQLMQVRGDKLVRSCIGEGGQWLLVESAGSAKQNAITRGLSVDSACSITPSAYIQTMSTIIPRMLSYASLSS